MPLKKGKMRYFKLIFLFCLVALITASCSGIGGSKDQELMGETHKGTQGITFNFLQNYPPSTIYTTGGESGNNIILEVKNLGSFTTGAWIYLSGFDPNIINVGPSSSFTGPLMGRSTTNPEGGYMQMQFPPYGSLRINAPKDIDIYPTTIQATACYDYETKASLPVCIDPNPFSPVGEKACTPHGSSVGGGQGAPVAITSVQQESLRGKTIFKIRIANSGTGQIIQSGYYSQCTDSQILTYDKFDKISILSIKLAGAGGQCTPGNNEIRLVNNQALITCVFNVPGNLPYTTTLDVNLRYGYMDSQRRSIQIKKIS